MWSPFRWGTVKYCCLSGPFHKLCTISSFFSIHLSANVGGDYTRHVIEKQNSKNMGNHDDSDSDSSHSDGDN